jgi:hypothetical protein
MIRFLKSPALPALLACALLQFSATRPRQSARPQRRFSAIPSWPPARDFEIKRSQVDDAFINYNAGVVASGRAIPDAERALVRSKLLEHLIINKILLQKATADDKARRRSWWMTRSPGAHQRAQPGGF